MMYQINGIQQVGLGVTDAVAAYNWYSKHLGFNILVFDDVAQATLMTQYTGNQVVTRRALLAMNLQGGGGIEIWQKLTTVPLQKDTPIHVGDLGINAIKIRCYNVDAYYQYCIQHEIQLLTKVIINQTEKKHFYIHDLYGNVLEIIEDMYQYMPIRHQLTGGVMGVVIGVSNMQLALPFYKNMLGYTITTSEEHNMQLNVAGYTSGITHVHSVLLTKEEACTGPFGALLAPSVIELVQVLQGVPATIYAHRHWGDCGYIHVCFDVSGMQQFITHCNVHKHAFTVNSINGFDMGKASGHFGYNQDLDGTLIEYVETHKVPLAKKWGIYYTIKQQKKLQNLPKWLVKLFVLARVKVLKK